MNELPIGPPSDAPSRSLTFSIASALMILSTGIALCMTVFHLWFAIYGPPTTEAFRATHFMLGVSLLFCTASLGKAPAGVTGYLVNLLLMAAVIVPSAYIILFVEHVTHRMLYVTAVTPLEQVLGAMVVVASLEAVRRSLGWPMVILAVLFMIYTQIGPMLPYPFWHRGYPPQQVIEQIFLSLDGLWGTPIGASASYIFLFVLFGALLVSSGAGNFFSAFANVIAGRFVGGPAKTAVVSSAFMSMLSGSSTANVVTTGSFTIPAMKRYGYDRDFAAGVEALASTGGLITPPVMGAAAFIMADFLGVSYATIMAAAAIPALLYFTAVFIAVDLEARRSGLKAGKFEQTESLKEIIRGGIFMIVPLSIMIYMLIDGYTPAVAGFYGIAAFAVCLPLLSKKTPREILTVFWDAAVEAPRMIAPVVVACAVGGLIAGIISLTGLGVRLTSIIALAAGSSSILFLILTMLVAIVLGMGMPTSAVYIVLASILAPGLINLGFEPLAAHMFIFFGAVMSNITPPLAIASFAAAAVAGGDPWKTSIHAVRMAAGVFMVPFVFCYSPALIGIGEPLEILHAAGSALIGIMCLSVAVIGWLLQPLGLWIRAIFLAAAVALVFPGWVSDVVGGGMVLVTIGVVYIAHRRKLSIVRSGEPRGNTGI